AEASAFLGQAFGVAIFLIFALLLAQFNRFRYVFLVLSAVVMSTIGVLLGLVVMEMPFSIVMTAVGTIALAGVVVNNNIVLIDTYAYLRQKGMDKHEAILETCRERVRPVMLTAVTAILGVLPIAFGVNLALLSQEVTVGAPSTQWWIALSSAIVFGLAFSTILTLVVTPAALTIFTRNNAVLAQGGMLGVMKSYFIRRRHAREAAALAVSAPVIAERASVVPANANSDPGDAPSVVPTPDVHGAEPVAMQPKLRGEHLEEHRVPNDGREYPKAAE
ncbi:MAG: efflux RND transporter permease subunit, partial [Pseudomonadota bacterium]